MCGIVGYVGSKEVVPVILEGLRRLEYRGYDSAGIAVGCKGEDKLDIRRAPGKLKNIEEVLRQHPLHGTYGIGHTRWATHGRPTEENAHPHRDCTGRIVVVHNGIVENYLELKRELTAQGHVFVTETDTEIIAHLIEQVQKTAEAAGAPIPLEVAARATPSSASPEPSPSAFSPPWSQTRSSPPASARPSSSASAKANTSSPLTSPASCTTPATSSSSTTARWPSSPSTASSSPTSTASPSTRKPQRITWDPIQAEKGGYKHFMLKEIWEQPRAIRDTTLGRVSLDSGQVFLAEMGLKPEDLAQATSINIAACGTSWHAATAGKYMIERLARMPVEVDYASEYRYRGPIADPNALGLLITQSGETADTLAAQREMIALGSKTVAICNVVGAMITRDANGTIYTHAGPEIGVASTKAFTSQITALFLFALHLAQVRGQLTPAESLHSSKS